MGGELRLKNERKILLISRSYPWTSFTSLLSRSFTTPVLISGPCCILFFCTTQCYFYCKPKRNGLLFTLVSKSTAQVLSFLSLKASLSILRVSPWLWGGRKVNSKNVSSMNMQSAKQLEIKLFLSLLCGHHGRS